jgi:hypothetical protein
VAPRPGKWGYPSRSVGSGPSNVRDSGKANAGRKDDYTGHSQRNVASYRPEYKGEDAHKTDEPRQRVPEDRPEGGFGWIMTLADHGLLSSDKTTPFMRILRILPSPEMPHGGTVPAYGGSPAQLQVMAPGDRS